MTGKCTSHIYGYSAFFLWLCLGGGWVFCCCVVCFLLVFVLSHPQGDLSRRIEFIVSREFYSSQDYGLRPCPKAETSHPKIKAHYIHIYRGLFCFSIHFNTITEGFFFHNYSVLFVLLPYGTRTQTQSQGKFSFTKYIPSLCIFTLFINSRILWQQELNIELCTEHSNL